MDGMNFTVYLSRHSVDATTAMWLGHALLAARPLGASESVTEALEGVTVAHNAVVTAHKRQQAQGSDDARPLHRALSAYWAALIGRVDHYCVLPPETYPMVAKAERLLELLAPDGNAALSLAFPACWTTLHTRLAMVDEAGLRGAMVDIAGAPFLATAESALDDFGRALGITAAPAATTEDNLRDLLREFMQAVSDYALQVAATVRRHKPETARAAQAALRPLEELRGMVRRRNASAEGEAEEGDEDDDVAAEPKEASDAKAKPDAKAKADAKAEAVKDKAPEKTEAAKEAPAEKVAAAPAAPPAPPRPSAQPMGTPSVAPPN